MRFAGIRIRFAVLLVIVTVVLIALYVFWRSYAQEEQAKREMLETTQVLATEMDAIWDFMELNQTQFVRREDGTYNLYCVVAAKAVAKLFTVKSGSFTIHYTNLTTRKPDDAPDAFEYQALTELEADPALEAYYARAQLDDGTEVFRYVEPLYMKDSCLDCHGSPAGELDIMGYAKEGKQVGDLAGAASIIMPAQTYLDNVRTNVLWETLIFGVLVVAGLAVLFWATSAVATAQMRRLEEENRQKSDFLSMVSHEIRTPLTSILAFSDIWAASNEPRNADEAKIMREMRVHSQALLGMVNNILDVARIEAGRMHLEREPLDVADLLGMVKSSLSYLAQKKNVTIRCSIRGAVPVLFADGEKLRRILENLVGNSIKFVDEGGLVEISAAYDEAASKLMLQVSDDGCGIALEDQDRVFERFEQGKGQPEEAQQPGNGRNGGSGLGLALVRELAELHGGTVQISSQTGTGSIFTVYVRATVVNMEDNMADGAIT
jgi:signal transduction histidine kinase